MEIFYNITSLWLFLASVPIGVFAIVFGGSMFLSIPIFQILFPEVAMGLIIGNIKVGSVIRNMVATYYLRKQIDWKPVWVILLFFCAGSFIGAFSASQFSQVYILPAIVIAILISEFGKKISSHIPSSIFYLAVFLTGVFGGLIGAGILIFIIALLRMRIKEDHHIHHVRALAIFTELLISFVAILVFWKTNLLKADIWIPWSAGSIFGGWIGGRIIHSTGKQPESVQRFLLRSAFAIALIISLVKII